MHDTPRIISVGMRIESKSTQSGQDKCRIFVLKRQALRGNVIYEQIHRFPKTLGKNEASARLVNTHRPQNGVRRHTFFDQLLYCITIAREYCGARYAWPKTFDDVVFFHWKCSSKDRLPLLQSIGINILDPLYIQNTIADLYIFQPRTRCIEYVKLVTFARNNV